MVSKSKIAALSAVGLAVILIAGGYGASIAKFNSSLDAAELRVADFINKEFNLSEREAVSVDFFETKSSGLFSRKLNLVIANPKYNMQVPVDAKIGFLKYDFAADLKNATVDGEKLFDAYRYELSNLTQLDLTGSAHLLTGKGSIVFDAKGLNDMSAAGILVTNTKEREAFQKDNRAFAESKGFKDVGELHMTVNVSSDLEMVSSGHVANILSDEFAINRMDFISRSKGIGSNVIEIGDLKFTANDLYVVAYNQLTSIEKLSVNTAATPFDKLSNFDLTFNVQAKNINGQIRDLQFDSVCRRLNYDGIMNVMERLALVSYLKKYPIDFEIQPSSKFTYIDSISGKDVEFTLKGRAKTQNRQQIEGSFTLEANADISKIAELAPASEAFEINGDKSVSQLQFKFPLSKGRSEVMLNGQPLF